LILLTKKIHASKITNIRVRITSIKTAVWASLTLWQPLSTDHLRRGSPNERDDV
jgi:hypothetical protein